MALPIDFSSARWRESLTRHMQQASQIREFLHRPPADHAARSPALLISCRSLAYYTPRAHRIVLGLTFVLGLIVALMIGLSPAFASPFQAEAGRQLPGRKHSWGATIKSAQSRPAAPGIVEVSAADAVQTYVQVGKIFASRPIR